MKAKANNIIKSASVSGNTATAEDLEKINGFTLKEMSAEDVFTFKVKMADNSTDDRNKEPFTLNALRQLKGLYVGKTVSKDHMCSADTQCARIFDTDLIDSEKTNGVNGEKVSDLVAKCYMPRTKDNEGLISEIEAGIKREVSTSCSCTKVVCSICGADLSKSYCAHRLGREYEGKTCYHLLDEIKDAYELSFVAVPAQPQAGTYKAYDDDEPTDREETEEEQKQAEAALRIADAYIFNESEELNHE